MPARLCLAGIFLLFSAAATWAGPVLSASELLQPGRLLMLRHANAPGNGDPPGFRIEYCATQRNLDASGRAQSVALGQRLARAGVGQAKVYSSQWCRCLETASLLGLGQLEVLPALNSFYPSPAERLPRMAALREFLAQLPTTGGPVILVTHQFTIAEFTGQGIESAGGSLFQLNGTGSPKWLGVLAPEGPDFAPPVRGLPAEPDK